MCVAERQIVRRDRCSVAAAPVHQAFHGLAGLEAAQVGDGRSRGGARLGHARDVRRETHPGVPPEGVRCGQRLGIGHVEHGLGDLPCGERCQQVRLPQLRAAAHVHEAGALRQAGEQPGVEEAARGIRERQQADQDVGAREEGGQFVLARETLHAGYGVARPAPARAGEAEAHELPEHGLAQRPQAQHAHAALRGGAHGQRLPFGHLLLAPVLRHVAVHVEHGVADVFHHAAHDARLHHADHGQLRWQRGKVELVHAGARGKQHLEVGKARGDVRRRLPGREKAHPLRIAHVGPDAELDVGGLGGEHLGPLAAAHGVGFVEEHHQPTACVTIA